MNKSLVLYSGGGRRRSDEIIEAGRTVDFVLMAGLLCDGPYKRAR